jgi:hypothetical protein
LSSLDKLLAVAERIGSIADSTQRKCRYFVLIGAVASAVLAFYAFSIDSLWWWNALKMGVLLLPAIIWCVVLLVLNQLKEAPELISQLVNDDSGLVENIHNFSLKEPDGLRGLFSTVKAFKQEEGFEVVFDTISGIGLIINPFFAFLAFLAMTILFLFILIAPFVLLL